MRWWRAPPPGCACRSTYRRWICSAGALLAEARLADVQLGVVTAGMHLHLHVEQAAGAVQEVEVAAASVQRREAGCGGQPAAGRDVVVAVEVRRRRTVGDRQPDPVAGLAVEELEAQPAGRAAGEVRPVRLGGEDG